MVAEMRSQGNALITEMTPHQASIPHNIAINMEQEMLEQMTMQVPQSPHIKDSLFQKELLTRVQKLEERSLEQILQVERMYQKVNETELKATMGKPAGPGQETHEAILKALKRIENLEKNDLNARIALKGPDEIFAMNETQKQIDRIVEKANQMMQRVEAVEGLTGSLVHREDEKSAVELKGMMSNLKSKFSFLDPQSDEQQQTSLTNQVALLEERFNIMNK